MQLDTQEDDDSDLSQVEDFEKQFEMSSVHQVSKKVGKNSDLFDCDPYSRQQSVRLSIDKEAIASQTEIKRTYKVIPFLELPLKTQISETLMNFFVNKEVKPDFYQNEFFSDRNQLAPQCKTNRKAFRIYLKGASNHVKALEHEIANAKMWKPREKEVKLKLEDDKTYKMTQARHNHKSPEEKLGLYQKFLHTNDKVESRVKEIGCQVSRGMIASPKHYQPYSVRPRINEANELKSLRYDDKPIVTLRSKCFNPMINSKEQKIKFDLTNLSPSNVYSTKKEFEIIVKSKREKQNKNLDLRVINSCSYKLDSQRFKLIEKNLLPLHFSKVPSEADILSHSLAASQVRVRNYYEKISGKLK